MKVRSSVEQVESFIYLSFIGNKVLGRTLSYLKIMDTEITVIATDPFALECVNQNCEYININLLDKVSN